MITQNAPAHEGKNILIITVGTSLQIITEAIFLPLKEGRKPDEIHLFTTRNKDWEENKCKLLEALKNFMDSDRLKNLEDPKINQTLSTMHEDYFATKNSDGDLVFNEKIIKVHIPRTKDNSSEMKDIKTNEDQVIFERFLFSKLSELHRKYKTGEQTQRNNRFYYCFAGGRKNMIVSLTKAVTLMADENDKFFHVILQDEEAKDLYWPKNIDDIEFCDVDVPFINQPLIIYLLTLFSADEDGQKFANSFVKNFHAVYSPKIQKVLWGFDKYDFFVDHGLNHTINILNNCANYFYESYKSIESIGDQKQTFLNDEELYVLLMSILFHDIGMSGTYKADQEGANDPNFDEVNHIRKFHSKFTYDRIANAGYEIKNGLNDEDQELSKLIHGCDLFKRFYKLIALTCKYHSRKLSFVDLKNDAGQITNEMEFACNIDFDLLVSLLRIFDVLDTQHARIQSNEILDRKIRLTLSQFKNTTRLICNILKINYDDRDINDLKSFNKIFIEITKAFDQLNKNFKEDNAKSDENKHLLLFNNNIVPIQKYINEIKLFFQQEPNHYNKHRFIKNVDFIYNHKINKIDIVIYPLDKVQNYYSFNKAILDIKDEFKSIYQKLDRAGNFPAPGLIYVNGLESTKRRTIIDHKNHDLAIGYIKKKNFIFKKKIEPKHIYIFFDDNNKLLNKDIYFYLRETTCLELDDKGDEIKYLEAFFSRKLSLNGKISEFIEYDSYIPLTPGTSIDETSATIIFKNLEFSSAYLKFYDYLSQKKIDINFEFSKLVPVCKAITKKFFSEIYYRFDEAYYENEICIISRQNEVISLRNNNNNNSKNSKQHIPSESVIIENLSCKNVAFEELISDFKF